MTHKEKQIKKLKEINRKTRRMIQKEMQLREVDRKKQKDTENEDSKTRQR